MPTSLMKYGSIFESGSYCILTDSPQAIPPPQHIQGAVRASNLFHSEHQKNAAPVTRAVQAATIMLGRPSAIAVLLSFTVVWIACNVKTRSFDPFPFSLLGTILSFLAVLVTLGILATQQHENQLSENRAKITLELAILSEQKLSKLIEMLDGLRHDMPDVSASVDPSVEALGAATDPQSIIETLQESSKLADADR